MSQVLLGVTGGVAAFKAAQLASTLVQRGFDVQAVMTEAAQAFIGKATLAALSGRPVATAVFDPRYPLGAHIELAQASDILCVAPATADFLANAAQGAAGDLLSTLYLAFQGPVLLAPAMNSEMWEHPAVQRNLEQLRLDGVRIVPPQEGWLSCRRRGSGRMADPETIISAIDQALSSTEGCT